MEFSLSAASHNRLQAIFVLLAQQLRFRCPTCRRNPPRDCRRDPRNGRISWLCTNLVLCLQYRATKETLIKLAFPAEGSKADTASSAKGKNISVSSCLAPLSGEEVEETRLLSGTVLGMVPSSSSSSSSSSLSLSLSLSMWPVTSDW